MRKKIISIVLAITILAGAGYTIRLLTGNSPRVLAGEYRGGFLLLPDEVDSSGVLADSPFTIQSQTDIDLAEIQKNLILDGQEKPVITQKAKNTFTIVPKVPMESNKLYTFRLKIGETPEITWTFQTRATFVVAGTLPADKTTNVPVNTGIEIYFSHSEYQNPDSYFEIAPKVNGRFERHKNAYVFVPDKALATGTFYTVTIKKDLKTTDGKTSLGSDYSFGFETAPDEKVQKDRYDKGYIAFNKVMGEYTPSEKPYLPINYYFNTANNKNISHKVNGTVYGYDKIGNFMAALEKRSATPVWAYYTYFSNNYIETDKLNKVLTFENDLSPSPSKEEDLFIKLPSALPVGFYVVDCTWEDIRFQTFIQVTEIGVYATADADSLLVWVNDLKTKKAISGAKITLHSTNLPAWTTNEKGISLFQYKDSDMEGKQSTSGEHYFVIEIPDGRSMVMRHYNNNSNVYYNEAMVDYFMPYQSNQNNNYWRYIQLDRSLYQPDDTVNFWGLVKNRYENEVVDKLTVEVVKGNYYPSFQSKGWSFFPMFQNEPVAKVTVTAKDGAFDGSVKLPALEAGNYSLQVKIGNNVVSTTSLTVDKFTKPAYKMEITTPKKAVFWYEPVDITLKSAFFEGSKVPGLNVHYNFQTNYNNQITDAKAVTDGNGEFKTSITPGAAGKDQGEIQAVFSVNATLPESGEITANESWRVFTNDIQVDVDSTISGTETNNPKQGEIKFQTHKITLDRLNNGTATTWNDYLGEVQAGVVIKGSVFSNRWIRYENGTYYDFINKVTTTRYDYRLSKEIIKNFTVTSDSKGFCSFGFNAPELSDGYYTYEATCNDNKGRTVILNGYMEGFWNNYSNYISNNQLYLDGVKEKYADNSKVSLELKKELEKPQEVSTLFIRSQNGIIDYSVSSSNTYGFDITDICKPNIYVRGVYFNGTTFVESTQENIVYDYSGRELSLSAKTDKETYKPGENVIIRINAKDKAGKGVKTIVNAGVVDEALFSLQNMTVSTLSSLYEYVPSGISMSYSSHLNSGMDFNNGGGMQRESSNMMTSVSDGKAVPNTTAYDGAPTAGKAVATREKFLDTALFKTIALNENGDGEISFTLPDNITAWRITLTGISSTLDAGSNTATLKVSLPFFINPVLNDTYLQGDKPAVGLTAYGNGLAAGESITYKVSTSSNPTVIKTAIGKAFERTNIPVGELSSEDRFILIEAESASGQKDAIKKSINVRSSYHEIDKATYYPLTPGLKIQGGQAGNTRLVFMDKGRGMYYPDLQSMLWQSGNRVDDQMTRVYAEEMLQTYFNTDNSYFTNESFKASDYQNADGGIALLPYGSSDLELSAKIAPFIKDRVDQSKLKNYFIKSYEDEKIGGLKAAALYGMAVLREPVLLEIGKAAKVNNAGIKDLLYLCLAYCELGEQPQAKKLFDSKVLPSVKQSGELQWIESGVDKDDTLEATALGSLVSAYFDTKTSENFYRYCSANHTKDILLKLEKLAYIRYNIIKTNPATGSFTYTYLGETKEIVLESGRVEYKEIPSLNIGGFNIDSVKGDVVVLAIYKAPSDGTETTNPGIAISRKFYNMQNIPTTSFVQDEVVKVELSITMDKTTSDGSYEVTDFISSGLKPIENTWMYGGLHNFSNNWYGKIDGQKISFSLYNYNNSNYSTSGSSTIYYYARVVSTGVYTAESPVIQGNGNQSGIRFGEKSTITIGE